MYNSKIAKTFGALLLGGALALGNVATVTAAENAAGVAEHMNLTVKTLKEALDAAKAGNKDAALSSIKQAKQHYKEITGDAAGKPLQDAIKRLKEAQAEIEKGNTAGGATILEEVVPAVEKVQKGGK
jgi:hypothetical protein